MANGLTNNAINAIDNDKNSTLWFGTDEGGVSTFNELSFSAFALHQ